MRILRLTILWATAFCLAACTGKGPTQEELGTRHGDPAEKVLVAYVFRMHELPDATYLTHINYAFGHVNDNFNGVRLENPEELHKLSGIKRTIATLPARDWVMLCIRRKLLLPDKTMLRLLSSSTATCTALKSLGR